MAALVDAGEPAKQPTRLDCGAVPLLCQGSEIAQKAIREVRPDVAASLALEPGIEVCRANDRDLGDGSDLHLAHMGLDVDLRFDRRGPIPALIEPGGSPSPEICRRKERPTEAAQ